jgi:hypothetical protein
MAFIAIKMSSLGKEGKCSGCDHEFVRGEQISGVVNKKGEGLGLFCEKCIKNWKEDYKKQNQ